VSQGQTTIPSHDQDRRRTILIVEDEPQVCELLTDMEAQGFATHCVQRDRQAYDALETGERFVCMIVDVNLGAGHTGYDVARFARKLDPGLPVIFVSGETSLESFKKNGVAGSLFVPKPFTADELLARLSKVIGDNDD
jgi:DNA-binding response OmpR family regulator